MAVFLGNRLLGYMARVTTAVLLCAVTIIATQGDFAYVGNHQGVWTLQMELEESSNPVCFNQHNTPSPSPR